MRFWSRFLYAGQKTFSASSRGWWGGVVEIGLATLLIFSGFLFLVAALAFQYLYSNTQAQLWHYTAQELSVRIGLASIALIIGFYRLVVALWKVSITMERRVALASAAGEIDLLRESKSDPLTLPNVPKMARTPRPGRQLRYQLIGQRRSFLWLTFTALVGLAALGMATILGVRFWYSLGLENGVTRWDYSALAMAVMSVVLGGWAVVGFVRQALRLAAFGPTLLEISDFPLRPMEKYHILLIQPGRFRFKLLDVLLICEEVATFTRGTDIQTERRVVVEERLFRHRGVVVKPTRPFEVEFDFELPQQIMHSFTSTDNQIQWKIVVQTTAKGWPQFEQAFPVVVLPPRVQDDRL